MVAWSTGVHSEPALGLSAPHAESILAPHVFHQIVIEYIIYNFLTNIKFNLINSFNNLGTNSQSYCYSKGKKKQK